MRNILILFGCCFICLFAKAQGYKNPILPGFYPDPSVCKAGEYYYLVNSSFQYFPGVPIHRSKDLINWESIGYVLNRSSQLSLDKASFWTGIYAPSIRFFNNTFYMTTTNVGGKGNFYVYTHKPEESNWSEPIWVEQEGIDPDIFFDDNGKVYFISAFHGIQISEIDIQTGKRLTATTKIWDGTGARHTEAPHIYKKDGYYYLLVAEGGTEYGHKVSIARSKNILGPYDVNPNNPILTHINQKTAYNAIQGTGHADLFQTDNGNWWAVFLGFRPQSYTHHLLGRETFLAPVEWEKNAWPIINKTGTIDIDMNVPTLPQFALEKKVNKVEFDTDVFGYEWNWICNPNLANYQLNKKSGYLTLKTSDIKISEAGSPTFLGRRQQHIAFKASTALDFSRLQNQTEAGLTVYMSTNYHYDISIVKKNNQTILTLKYEIGKLKHIEKEILLHKNKVFLSVEGKPDEFVFSYSEDDVNYIRVGEVDTRFLSSETAGGFTGVYLGLYAQNLGKQVKESYADFDWFNYSF